jgi:hypothetical protein
MKLLNFIVCDDIRREIGNKHSLVGVYDDLVIHRPSGLDPKNSISLKLGFFIRIALENEKEAIPDAFNAIFTNNGTTIAKAEGIIQVQAPAAIFQLALVFPLFGIPQNASKIECTITFQKDAKNIATLKPDPLLVKFVEMKAA